MRNAVHVPYQTFQWYCMLVITEHKLIISQRIRQYNLQKNHLGWPLNQLWQVKTLLTRSIRSFRCFHRDLGRDLSTVKNMFSPTPPPPTPRATPSQVVYATDRSKAVVRVLFLFCVALWFILRGASCFKVFPCSLSLCFFIRFGIVITSRICLFVLYVLVFVIFLFLLVSVVGCVL